MYLRKGVEIIRVQSMSDGTVRLTIDLHQGPTSAEDIKTAYSLREVDTTMILAPTQVLEDVEND